MLPAAVREVLAERLEGRARGGLAAAHTAISASYRQGRNSAEKLRTDADALAYAAARMPATFAAADHALDALATAAPDLSPVSLLDAGCGPGTAAMAAVGVFPGLRDLTLIDRNEPLLQLARALVPAASPTQRISVEKADLDPVPPLRKADLVVAAYVLAELPQATADRLAAALWEAAGQALVIAEPGTPDGFARLRRIREALIGAGAHVAAPCTHHAACPMSGQAWCRVPVRVQRSRDHRALKGAALGYEDESLAYLALTREQPSARTSHRIIGQTRRTKADIRLPACGSEGLADISAPSRNRETYKRFSKLGWGDAVENPIQAAAAPNPE
jgi:ribosomal protein RSM22 (predicted rRNA methylase)